VSDKSPLFVSSMELLAHATELFALDEQRKHKFVILHLANAIELIFKDRLIDKGVSIYVPKTSQTLTIWQCFDQLAAAGVQVPERPVIELLVDDRNTIQHRFGYPDVQTVFYYWEQVVTFFRRFLADEYGLDLADVLKEHLSPRDLALLGLAKQEPEQEAALDRLFALSPESAILRAFNLIERRFVQLLDIAPPAPGKRPQMPWSHPDFPHLLDELAIGGYVSHEAARNFNTIREMRNKAAHAAYFETNEPIERWRDALELAKRLLSGLDKALREELGKRRLERKGTQGIQSPEGAVKSEEKVDDTEQT
jgi:hypothetical protein